MSKVIICLLIGFSSFYLTAQELPVPKSIGEEHPRIFGQDMSLEETKLLVQKEEWAADIIEKTKERLKPYINHYKEDKDWLVSRLQMYWESKSDQIYINGGNYDHAEGEAPVPTVKFIGGRGTPSDYKRPKLEDIKPYMDDPRGLYLQNKSTNQWEWAAIRSTGGTIASINREILSLARDAAFLYWFEGKEIYADMASEILDTYLKGIYYLNEPIDLSHGHHQTLVSYTQFEVIQEHVLNEITQAYDFLHDYIEKTNPQALGIYDATLQKWADLLIKNGVSFNNWNLLQAAHISNIALVLEDNEEYENGKGGPYYMNVIMNKTSTRQWSMRKLIDYGYDPETGIWNESPGYSINVLSDFIHFAEFYDRNFNIDLVEEIPVLKKATKNAAQYLYPNKYKVGFGDGHYSHLRSGPIIYMIQNAQKYDKPKDEVYFTRMLKTIYNESEFTGEFEGHHISDLFAYNDLRLNDTISKGELSDFTSPLFYAPNTSWIAQRQGEDANDALMISEIASLGNHMHSNGIAMELYGKGLPLAPEMGHGSSYFSIEYAEYYTQFPAHNTVIVNGKSKYPVMKSNHAFSVKSMYPKSESKNNVPGFTFSDVLFREPETNSDQRRLLGIVKNEKGGYYIDIFRSKQQNGKDVKHEYFYHNLGQKLELSNRSGKALNLEPTTKLAFGDGDLMAYDYMWDKKSVETDQDFKGRFSLELEDRIVNMNFWVAGEEDREIFSVLSPHSTAFRHGLLPENLKNLPIPTLVVRQNGQAWSRPFVAVYEPAENNTSNMASVDYFGEGESVGIHVTGIAGKEDYIFSNTSTEDILEYEDMSLKGTYGIIIKKGEDFTMFLGNGKEITAGDYRIASTDSAGTAAIRRRDNVFFFSADVPIRLAVPSNRKPENPVLRDEEGNTYKGKYNRNMKQILFDLPILPYQQIEISTDR